MHDDAGVSATAVTLASRARWLKALRHWFEQEGFWEIETPLLSHDTVIDRHLEPIAVPIPWISDASGATRTMYLQTSPEFGMKRALRSSLPALYQITRAFRQDELGQLHNPEFTIAEWYHTGDDYAAGIERLGRLAVELLGVDSWRVLSYREAFVEFLEIDPWTNDLNQLAAAGRRLLPDLADSFADADRDQWLEVLLSERIQPRLGREQAVILCDYPASQAALAQVRQEPFGPVAERFELFVHGIELANGYHELLDPDELRRRNRETRALRHAAGRPELPLESRLLAAMDLGLPACTGVALGVDRAIQVALGKASLTEVLAFPFDRA